MAVTRHNFSVITLIIAFIEHKKDFNVIFLLLQDTQFCLPLRQVFYSKTFTSKSNLVIKVF